MRIDPKYFNTFMIIVAIVAAIIIVWGTFTYRANKQELFRQRIAQTDSLAYVYFPRMLEGDSVRVRDFEGRYLLLDLWAEWSDPSIQSHKYLQPFLKRFSDTLEVIAASVREDSGAVAAYRQRTGYSYEFVEGTGFYHRMDVPGLPTQLLFGPDGKLIGTFLGFTDSTRYDSLQRLIQTE